MTLRLLLFCCLVSSRGAVAQDWPMWRGDAGRTGVTQTPLPEDLVLSWSRQLPALTPAYHNSRLQFDAGYEPIIAEGKLLLASSLHDCVTAYDAKTGEEAWRYVTNGPVRFAPAVWQDSVCLGSDDGHLYCVDLNSGTLKWKHRAVPSERLVLGNRRLISVWPVRGGPVVMDGKVYFAAGVWPFEGVFVYAMDVASGDVIWRNDRLGYLFGQQPHNTEAIGGLAPQGYLVAKGNDLIVPCSTAYPALLNRETGELKEFELPAPPRYPGGWFAAIDEVSARAVRRGKLTFDDVVNRQQHEDKEYKGQGISGISRMIMAGKTKLIFDDGYTGVDGTVHSMAAADDRLFVTTREGGVYCFAKATPDAKDTGRTLDDLSGTGDVAETPSTTTPVVETSAFHGYAFVIGLKDGATVKAILQTSEYQIVAVDNNAERVANLRTELRAEGQYGKRVAVMEADLATIELPPYAATLVTTERPNALKKSAAKFLQSLRPFGGSAVLPGAADFSPETHAAIRTLEAEGFTTEAGKGLLVVRRDGPLPGSTNYNGDWSASADDLVRYPLGVLWFDDTLAHFKRSPQPKFIDGVMISRPKNWHAERMRGDYKTDYPLLPAVLSDMYTGRVFDETEQAELQASLEPTDPKKAEPSQYRPPRQKDAWKPEQPVAGERTNPLTGEKEVRTFPKTYGCDGGVDYGSFYTLRAGTPAFYDKTAESGTVFLSGPRSGCTNSIIPAGGLLNVPYFYEGCTCSYPLPTAMSLVAMPERHEQWSSWGETEVKPDSIQRIGLNFGAPGDRVTRAGTLWLDVPSVGGPSPKVRVGMIPETPTYHYRHSVWMQGDDAWPWVAASSAEGLQQVTVRDLKPGQYTVRLYFAEMADAAAGERVLDVSVNAKSALQDFDIVAEAGAAMTGIVREFDDVEVGGTLTVDLSASKGKTLLSGLELVRLP
ncbi:PQQ-binding-like beta-propeller repeat protein [Fuerstiella marisgermanici]|nr:PQQ-binding-like beta-propeller repeat protein [Fuerstiella marisgermanici]